MMLSTRIRYSCRWAGLGFIISLSSVGVLHAQGVLDETLSTLEQWVDTQRRIAQERNVWETERESIRNLIDLYGEELETLTRQIEESQEDVSAADAARQELTERDDRLKEIEESVRSALASAENGLKELRPRLPQPLQEELQPLFAQLPADPGETELSIGQRIQFVVGILTQVQKFNTVATVTETFRELPSGETIQVDTIYFGLGSAYYVDKASSQAGYATLGAEGWNWTDAPELSGAVRRAVNIYRGAGEADYIELPVQID